jgi:glycosyltransferase involved in cell wall biosynthesis
MKKPIVFAGLITKNEERDLPRCLRSIDLAVDGVVIVDTGSIDRTLEIAKSTILKPVYTRVYTGASKRDENGDWKLWDFSKARNVFVREIERLTADCVLWMDADDELSHIKMQVDFERQLTLMSIGYVLGSTTGTSG